MSVPPQGLPLDSEQNEPRAGGPSRPMSHSSLLKACVFATGLAGIVAEYVMATLATYLLGDAILQWTLTISLMLFAMGVGSRLSRFTRGPLLDAFVLVELLLSVVCASSAAFVYLLFAWVTSIGVVIYSTAFLIGLLIGFELPLATRLNDVFEELRINISSVMEKDYYGALFGGLLFAFVALPYLGLTYTPIVLGAINFAVAAVFFLRFRHMFQRTRLLQCSMLLVPIYLIALTALARPIMLHGEQSKYRDLVIYQRQTPYQRIVMTRWKDHHWLYLDGNIQFSSYDEERYHEPLVHPAMALGPRHRHVLILGGGDGLVVREVLKHSGVETVTVVDIDPVITELAQKHEVLRELNQGALEDERVEVLNRDAYTYLRATDRIFDVVIADFPDPKSVAVARLYSLEFYQLLARHIGPGGVLVTQSTSPFFSQRAFLTILKTVRAAGIPAVAYHNHIPTMGEWSWVLGMKGLGRGEEGLTAEDLKRRVLALNFEDVETRFLNPEGMLGMLSFGKGILDDLDSVEVCHEMNLSVLYEYRQGEWDLY